MVNISKDSRNKLKPIKFLPVPKLLDQIGVAMYSKFNKAISELIVNGYDADATRVDVDVKYNKTTIKDNGTGMDEDEIRNNYMELGSDRKRTLFSKTPVFGRLPIGNKGIGKLAALGVAKRLTVITKKKGKKRFKYTIDREELDKKRTLEEGYFDLEPCNSSEIKGHGTKLELTKILPHVKIDSQELRGYLAREIPQDENFQIYVDGKKCEIADILGKKYNVEIVNKVCGKIEGEVIVAKKSFSNIIKPGISTTVRGRVVGEPGLFDVNRGGHKYVHANFLTGKVEVIGFDPEIKPDRIPVIKTDREGFNVSHPKYKAYHNEMTDLLIKICRQEEKMYYARKRMEQQIKSKHLIKNVIEDFKKSEKKEKLKSKEDVKGLPTQDAKKKEKKLSGVSPIGIPNAKVKLELQKMSGVGSIKLDDKEYKLTMRAMGSDDLECRIDDEISVVNINVDHPAYMQAIKRKGNVEWVLFRAIADAHACKISSTSEEMYERIDKFVRAQAAGMEQREAKKSGRR